MRRPMLQDFGALCVFGLVILSGVPCSGEFTATWTSRGDVAKLPDGPGSRQWHKIIYDPVRKKVVVFGGSSGYYNDVWYYDTMQNQWAQIEPWICPVVFDFTPPLGRDDFSFAYDEYNDLYWLHGGGGYKCNEGTLEGSAQAGTTGVKVVMGSEIPVQASDFYRHFTVKAAGKKAYVTSYDSTTHSVSLDTDLSGLGPDVTFGLYPQRGGGTFFYDPSGGEWTGFDGPRWNYSGPNPNSRKGGAFAYSSSDRALVLFGGVAGFTDTWVMDVQSKRWTEVIPHGTTSAPPARNEIANAMVYDRAHDVFVLFGGRCLDSSCVAGDSLGDTWVYDLSANTWTAMTPPVAPPPREQHMMAYDRVNEVTVLFGGRNDAGVLYNDLWVYDHGVNRWTEVLPAQSPSARRLSSLVHDEDQNLFVLYGGAGAKGGLRDLWVLSLQDDGTIPPNSPPTAVATVTPSGGDTRIEFSFDGSQSFDMDGTISTYQWDFGDGSTSSGALVSHTYSAAGTYTASLTVADDDLASHSTTIDLVVDELLVPATITIQSVVVRGSVDDPTVSEVMVDGIAFPVIGGVFEVVTPVTANPTLVVIEATNGLGATSSKRLTIAEQ